MKVTMTLFRYLARNYFVNTAVLLFALLSIVYLFDMVELIRRATKYDDVSMGMLLQMGLLKLPDVGQILFPFAILFGAMFTFWQFNRRSELVVLRSSGFSVWQFIYPVLFVAVLAGAIQVTAVNPLGALLVGKYEQLEGRYLDRQHNEIAIFDEGFWMRQDLEGADFLDATGDSSGSGYVIINARSINAQSADKSKWNLNHFMVLYFDREDVFIRRVDAPQAWLEPGQWVLRDVTIHNASGPSQSLDRLTLQTRLTVADIEESFSSPQTMSFWYLPQHIKTLEDTGFDASRLRVHYQSLLAQPLFLAAMVLLAAIVSMRPPRSGGVAGLLAIGIFTGFFVFFLSSYLQALGASQQIPPFLAAWSPALICSLLGLSTIMSLEDG